MRGKRKEFRGESAAAYHLNQDKTAVMGGARGGVVEVYLLEGGADPARVLSRLNKLVNWQSSVRAVEAVAMVIFFPPYFY